jgi:translation initiation factor IF-2
MRIHELAKELGVSSKEMLETLEKMGVTGKSASSSVPEDLVPRLRASGGKATKAAKPRQVMEPPPKPRAKPKPKKITPTAVPALAVEEAAPAEDAAADPLAGAPAPATTTTAVPPAPTPAAPAPGSAAVS